MSGDWEFIFICLLIYIIYKLISNWKKSTKKGGLAKSQEAASNAFMVARGTFWPLHAPLAGLLGLPVADMPTVDLRR